MQQGQVPVGTATKAGLGTAALAFAGAILAYLTGDHSQQALGGITAAGVGTVSLLATLAGRFIQSNTLLKRAETIGQTALADVEKVDPQIVPQVKAFLTGEFAKVHAHIDGARVWQSAPAATAGHITYATGTPVPPAPVTPAPVTDADEAAAPPPPPTPPVA